MRGGFRRGRLDKVSQAGFIGSYQEAIYPPRVYHYYTLQSTVPAASASVVIVPSIDDGVGDSRGKETPSPGVCSVMDKRSPALLCEFACCFIDANRHVVDSRAFAIAEAEKEPLNMLHYPFLLGSSVKDETTDSDGMGKKATQSNNLGNQQIRQLEDALGLPMELRLYGLVNSHGEMSTTVMDRLRIRPVKRKRIIKPVRRGAKVVVLPYGGGGTEDIQDGKKTKRTVVEGKELEDGSKAHTKHKDDDLEEEGGGGYDKDDDEASLSYQVDDDDDGGDLDGPEESGGDEDFF